MSPISQDTATRLSTDLVRVMKLLGAMRQHAPRVHPGVEPTAYPILFSLVDGPRRVSSLAECVHSDVSTVSRQVTSLVSHELIAKLPDPDDGRATMVSLSDQGHALVAELKQRRGEWFRVMLEDWEPEEAEAFIVALERLTASFQATRDRLMRASGAAWSTPPATPSVTPVGNSGPHSTSKEQ